MFESRVEQLRKLADRYLATRQGENVTLDEMAEWIDSKKLYEVTRKQRLGLLKLELSGALTTAVHQDPQGGTVRTYGCVQIIATNGDQKAKGYLWNELAKATWEFAITHFHRLERGVIGSKQKLDYEVQSHNLNHRPKGKKPIKLLWDFEAEAEAEAS